MSEFTYKCPSPDCEVETRDASKLATHVNEKHPDEWRRDDWPDTEAGRAGRESDQGDDSDGEIDE